MGKDIISTIKELKTIMDMDARIWCYGAGTIFDVFVDSCKQKLGDSYIQRIEGTLVSSNNIEVGKKKGIRVVSVDEGLLQKGDVVLLTVGDRYVEEICRKISKYDGVTAYVVDIDLFRRDSYQIVYQDLTAFIKKYPDNISRENNSIAKDRKLYAWTLWWQGYDDAPEIVHKCIESQKKFLPENVCHIVITKDNCEDYIDVPPYIYEKIDAGFITLTTFSDIIRAMLLYKYGGLWMDATILLSDYLDSSIFTYPLYTRNLKGTQFCSKAMWSGWFFCSKPGHMLFRFLSEAFLYYFKHNDSIKEYLMIDYIIAIACNTFPEIQADLNNVPYNNENALLLERYMTEQYEKNIFKNCMEECPVHKLSYKTKMSKTEGTIYEYLISGEV